MALTIFTDNDVNRVIKYLQLGAAYTVEDYVTSAMAAVETQRPTIVPSIQADLNTLDTLDAAQTTEKGSTSNALIKADVLEWESSAARTAGISDEITRIASRVASTLGLSMGAASSGMGTLFRG